MRKACLGAALAILGSMITFSVTKVAATNPQCYNTGDPTYNPGYTTTEQVTICHNTTDEGLYYNVPAGYWSFVQQASLTTTAGMTLAVAFTSASTVNNTIVALVQADAGTTSSVTDSNGDTFTQQKSQTSGTAQLSVWTATVGTGATLTVTGHFSAPTAAEIAIEEYSGVGAVETGGTAGASGVGTTANSGATAASTQTDDLVVGAVGAGQSFTTSAPFTRRTEVTATGTLHLLAEDADGSSWGTAEAATATVNNLGGPWAAIAVVFKHSSYGQIEYNVQPMRTAPNTYHTVLHSDAKKLTDGTHCPLDNNGVGIGAAAWPSPANPFPTSLYGVLPNPFYQYAWCTVGDSTKVASYNATSYSDPTPYTMGSIPSYALWGSQGNPSDPPATAANYYGNTTGLTTATLSQPVNNGSPYTSFSVNPLPFSVGANAVLQLSNGTATQNVELAPWQQATLGSGLTSGNPYSTLSLSTGLSNALPPNSAFQLSATIGGTLYTQTVTTSAAFTELNADLTAGNTYTSLSVSPALPYTIPVNTVITIGQGGTNQAVQVSSQANAGTSSISVEPVGGTGGFVANANYWSLVHNPNPVDTPILSPAIPQGATTMTVNKFVASQSWPSGTTVNSLGLPAGSTVLPVCQPVQPGQLCNTSITANATYQTNNTTITLVGDQQGFGGAANPMTVAGPYYTPYNNNYYYSYLVGEYKTDTNPTCPWVPWSAGACGWREVLMEARTTDFVNWQVLTNNTTSPWQSMSALSSTVYPVPVKDRTGQIIKGAYPDTAGDVGGLLGSISDVYSPADGVHTYRYFYADHPVTDPTNHTTWESDLQTWNLYERDASTADAGAFNTNANDLNDIVWSAPTLVASNVPSGALMRVAKAHGTNRWAILYTTRNGSNPTDDAVVEYSADMTTMTHSQWLGPLTHLLQNLPAAGTDYLNVQTGRLYGTGYSSPNCNGLCKSYLDLVTQLDFMTDRDGNVSAPDAETPGWTRGGMITWTDFPYVADNSTGQNSVIFGAYGAKVYRAGFDVSSNSTGDLAVNGTFNTQTFTGNPTNDGWTMIDEHQAGWGTNYPPSVLVNSGYTTGVAALVGTNGSESPGGSGMEEGVLIPSGSNSATIKFSYWDKCQDGGGDVQYVYIYDAEKAATTWIVAGVCDNTQTWTSVSQSLSSTWFGDHVYVYVQTKKVNTSLTDPVQTVLACQTWCVSFNVT